MKVISTIVPALSTLIVLLTSCREFIEPSLENDKVFLHAPADSAETNKYLQSFWWEPVDDALYYRLQIASTSFDRPVELLLDSLVESNKFSVTLEPGQYQWRVRAENGSSQSFYSTRNFTIHQSSIASQQVQLKIPVNGATINQPELALSWYSMYGASEYRLQIDTANFSDESALFYNLTTPNVEAMVRLSKDRTYRWRVKAESDSAESKWSPVYSFIFDGTPPGRVSLTFPETNTSMVSPVSLQWERVNDAKQYQLFISKPNDPTREYNPNFPLTLTGTSYTFSQGKSGELLYWKVRAVDAAGNAGEYSQQRNFTIQ